MFASFCVTSAAEHLAQDVAEDMREAVQGSIQLRRMSPDGDEAFVGEVDRVRSLWVVLPSVSSVSGQ